MTDGARIVLLSFVRFYALFSLLSFCLLVLMKCSLLKIDLFKQ